MFKGKTVVLGVSSSIAAYKAAGIASALVKKGCDVNVIMTQNATKFISPITFEELTKHKCLVDTFDRNFEYNIAHIALAQKADVFIIAPATANVIGKIANGIADDMLTTTIMAAKCPKIIAPAMNTNMYDNPIVQNNLKKLENYGYTVISPADGRLACGAVGKGKLPDESVILDYIERALADKQDFSGKKVLVTAGATRESIDPVRYITNHSSGKMGYAIAKAAMLRGADVTLVSGVTSLSPVPFVKTVDVVSAQDMFEAVTELADESDIIIKSAAVADFRPAKVNENKIKKRLDAARNSSSQLNIVNTSMPDNFSAVSYNKKAESSLVIELEETNDILKHIGQNKRANQIICGFSMETENMIENSKQKLERKNLDMIVCNNLKDEGAGFQCNTNKVTIITKNNIEPLALMSKSEVADELLNRIAVLCADNSVRGW